MKTKLCLFTVLGIALVLTSIGLAESPISNPDIVEESCQEIANSEFVGKVCNTKYYNGSIQESRNGRWFNADGSILSGYASNKRKDGSYINRKGGWLFSATFQGTYNYYLTATPHLISPNEKPTEKIEISELFYGRWQISPKLILQGRMSIQRTPEGKVIIRDERKEVVK